MVGVAGRGGGRGGLCALNQRISPYILARCPLHLGFLENLVLNKLTIYAAT